MADYTFGGTSSGSGGYSFARPRARAGGEAYSQQQLLSLLKASQEPKHRSLLGSILKGGGSALSKVLNVISRPAWAMAEGTRRGLEGEGFDFSDFVKGASRGIQAKRHTTFSDVLEQEGVLQGHGRLRAVAGFGLDVLTDPTLPLLVGATVASGGAASPLLAARLAVLGGSKRGLVGKPLRDVIETAEKALGKADDAISRGHKEWLRQEKRKIDRELRGEVWTDIDDAGLTLARESAEAEFEDVATKVFQASYKIPFTRGKGVNLTPTTIGGKRVAPKVPSLKRTAAGEGLMGKIPMLPATAGALGRTFKYGFNEEQFAKPALAAQKTSELIMDQYSKQAGAIFTPFRHLSEEDREKALKFGEEAVGIVQGTSRTLNEPMLERAVAAKELTPDQAGFLTAWHSYFNDLRLKDKAYGIAYEKELGDKVYVPHVYTREGGIVSKNALSEAGYAKERVTDFSISEIKRLKSESADVVSKYNIETDIMALAATRTRRAAQKQASQLLKDHMRRTYGVVEDIPNIVARNKMQSRAAELWNRKGEVWTHDPEKIRLKRSAAYRRAQAKRDKRAKEIFVKATDDVDDLNLRLANKIKEVAGGKVAAVPTFAQLGRISEENFERSVKALPKQHRQVARSAYAVKREVNAIRREMERLGPRAHGSKYRRLAARAIQAGQRIGLHVKNSKLDVDVEDIVDRNKIGYAAQPQGRQGKTIKSKKKEGRVEDPLDPKRRKTRGESWRSNIDEHLSLIDDKTKKAMDELKKIYPTPRVTPTPQYDKIRARIEADAAKQLKKVVDKEERERNAFEEELARQFDVDQRKLSSLDKRINRLMDRSENVTMKNPGIPEGWVRYQAKLDGQHYRFSPQMNSAMSRVERVLDDETVYGDMLKTMRKLTSYWKLGVTSVNPGYRVRNTLSDIWNMYIAGVPMARVVQYGAKTAALQRRLSTLQERIAHAHAIGKDYPLTKAERKDLGTFVEAYNHGILSGLFQGDIQTLAAMYRAGSFTRAFARKKNPLGAFVRAAQTFNRHGENWGRITHYLYRRDYERLGPQQAADWVKKAHFDYEELTPVEQQKFKTFIPFYTWTRKNIPYQLIQLASRPGKYATFPKSLATSNELATGDSETDGPQEGTMPEWMRQKMAFRIPGMGNLYGLPQIGVADLSKLEQSPFKTIGEMAHPGLRILFEGATGRSMLTGEKIAQGKHPRKPISDAAGAILSHVPGANVGPTARTVRGERVEGTGANPWVGYIAGQLPWLNQIVNREASIKQQQQGSPWLSRLSFLGGVSAYDRDLETELSVAQITWDEKMQRILTGLRDQGTIPPPKQRSDSEYQKKIQKLLGGSNG